MAHQLRSCLLAAVALLATTAHLEAQSCSAQWASSVIASTAGSSSSGSPSSALGSNPDDYFGLGNGGTITLAFPEALTNSGSSASDLFIDEWGSEDCFKVAVMPADAATTAALQAAGISSISGNFWLFADTFCGPENIDLDAKVPGYGPGQLRFSRVLIKDDNNGGNGAEISRVKAERSCPPPPQAPAVCVPGYATTVVNYSYGSGQTGTRPSEALGSNANDYHNLGNGGWIIVSFAGSYTTSGNAAPDIFVDEWGAVDCYTVRVTPGDAATTAALQAAGIQNMGNNHWQLPQTFCGDANIDLDAYMPGHAARTLCFTEVKVFDDGDGGNGAEVALIQVGCFCAPPPSCEIEWAKRVISSNQGSGAQSTSPQNALNDTPDDYFSLGMGGRIVLGFSHVFSNNGTTTRDLEVDEYGATDCYYVGLMPANATTQAALVAAGLAVSGGFYEFPGTFCGDQDIDLDALLPGHAANTLYFTQLRLRDDGTAGDGAEIARVKSKVVCDICIGSSATVNQLFPTCANPLDPILTAPAPALGSPWTLTVDSAFPNSHVILFVMLGPPIPQAVPGTNCWVYLNLSNLIILTEGVSNAAGDFSLTIPLANDPTAVGVEVTFQARVCSASHPGPIPGFPDWLTNGLHVRIGCP